SAFALDLAFTHSGRLSGRRALAFDLDLTAPFSPRPNAGIEERVNRQDAGLAATGQSPLLTLGWAGIPAFPK
ncbi:hypothetical protein, partial [Pseudomonas sp. Z18(2022)]|uniref:hypothetical protein n=1 Tax=Pseudomonas sp. Z18(2022) TaxID=2983410 RepID=UPI002E819676